MNNEATTVTTIKEEINGIEFEYLEGHRPTEEQILWIDSFACKDSFGEAKK